MSWGAFLGKVLGKLVGAILALLIIWLYFKVDDWIDERKYKS